MSERASRPLPSALLTDTRGILCRSGFGGGTHISMNGMWNSCRESGDHGVINTWDRTPYLTTVRTGEPSLIPAYNNVTRNLFISDYNSFDGIDNDDGSSYVSAAASFAAFSGSLKDASAPQYDISHNVFYLNEGLKFAAAEWRMRD